MTMVKGWIYRGVNAIPVEILDSVNDRTVRVRFLTRKMGLKRRVGVVAKSGVSRYQPDLTGDRP
jgi:hypothetical protein